MFESDSIQYMLDSKREKDTEFFINLFEFCNLNCAFCWQDHNDKTGLDTIINKAYSITKVANKDINNNITLNVMGGELFCDDIEDKTFNDYFEFTKYIFLNIKKNIKINWVTNLVFSNTDRVKELINKIQNLGIETALVTSYDHTGRFNPGTLKIFKKNLIEFGDMISSIGMVLTKPNIENLIRNEDENFKEFYNSGIPLYLDYYSPEKNHKAMAPSDKDLLEAFYFLIDNYPNVNPLQNWILGINNNMTCRSSKIVNPDGSFGGCQSLMDKETSQHLSQKVDFNNNIGIENNFVNKFNCLTCEYFQRCGLGCFLQHDFLKRGQLNECLFKLVFDKITNKE